MRFLFNMHCTILFRATYNFYKTKRKATSIVKNEVAFLVKKKIAIISALKLDYWCRCNQKILSIFVVCNFYYNSVIL